MNKKIYFFLFILIMFFNTFNIDRGFAIENNLYELVDTNYSDNFLIESQKWNITEYTEGAMDTQGWSLHNTPTEYHCINNFTGRELPIKISANAAAYEGIKRTYAFNPSIFACWILKSDTKNHYIFIANSIQSLYTGGFYFSGTTIQAMGYSGSTTAGGTYYNINSNEWYHVIFEITANKTRYYINGNVEIEIQSNIYTLRDTIFLLCYTSTGGVSTAYFSDLYVGNNITEAFKSYTNSRYYTERYNNISVESYRNVSNIRVNVSTDSNISQNVNMYIFNADLFEEFDYSFQSYQNCYICLENITQFYFSATNSTNPFLINISINIIITYFSLNETIEEEGITIQNLIENIFIEQNMVLLIVLLCLALYCNVKYNGIIMNAFWLFTISIYGVFVLSNSTDFWFPLIVVLFNAIIQLGMIAKNYEKRK